jgi:hypothetical protein
MNIDERLKEARIGSRAASRVASRAASRVASRVAYWVASEVAYLVASEAAYQAAYGASQYEEGSYEVQIDILKGLLNEHR